MNAAIASERERARVRACVCACACASVRACVAHARVDQVKLNPYLDSNLDLVETVLTLILLLISCCGMIFSAYTENAGFEPWHKDSLGWLTYLSMVFGSFLCAALLANEMFEYFCGWYLNRVKFLGDPSADLHHRREGLAYSKTALAHVQVDLPESPSSKATGAQLGSQASTALVRRPSSVLIAAQKLRKHIRGSYVFSQDEATEAVSSEDTKLFYTVNLLRFRLSMQRLDSPNRSSCVKRCLSTILCCATLSQTCGLLGRFQASLRHLLRALRPYVRDGSGRS